MYLPDTTGSIIVYFVIKLMYSKLIDYLGIQNSKRS